MYTLEFRHDVGSVGGILWMRLRLWCGDSEIVFVLWVLALTFRETLILYAMALFFLEPCDWEGRQNERSLLSF